MKNFCSNCGNKLEKNTAICLNCGVIVDNEKAEKKKGMPVWAIILIVVGVITTLPIIILTIIALITYSVVTDTNVDFEEYFEEKIMETQNGTIGDTLIAEDFKITLEDVKIYSDSIENNSVKPKEGKEFIVLFFDIENISDEKEYITINDFESYVDSYTVSPTHIYSNINNIEELQTTILPGKKTKGYIMYEVNKNWEELEINYENYDGVNIMFKIENKNISNINGV